MVKTVLTNCYHKTNWTLMTCNVYRKPRKESTTNYINIKAHGFDTLSIVNLLILKDHAQIFK